MSHSGVIVIATNPDGKKLFLEVVNLGRGRPEENDLYCEDQEEATIFKNEQEVRSAIFRLGIDTADKRMKRV